MRLFRFKINQNLFFAPTLTLIILLLGFFVLPTNLKDSFSYYPLIFLLTIAFAYLKLSIFLFSILDKFNKSQTAISLLINLILAIGQLWSLSLATKFLTLDAYPVNTFQFLAISQFGFFIQVFLNGLWQTKRLNLIVIFYYIIFLPSLYLTRNNFDLRWSIIFYQFIAIFGLILELFTLHQILKTLINKQNKNKL